MKVYLSVEQREFIIEACLELASALQENMPKDRPEIRDLCEEKIQNLRAMATLLRVEDHEK